VSEYCDASGNVVAEDWYVSFLDLAAEYFDFCGFFERSLYVVASSKYNYFWSLCVE